MILATEHKDDDGPRALMVKLTNYHGNHSVRNIEIS
jgi:hypothetical protein